VGFVVDKMAPGQFFSEYFGFPCQPQFIPPTSPFSQSPGTGKIGQYMAAVPRGHPIWTPPPTIRIKKKLHIFSRTRWTLTALLWTQNRLNAVLFGRSLFISEYLITIIGKTGFIKTDTSFFFSCSYSAYRYFPEHTASSVSFK
jgi:hypothetical protein